MSQDPFISAKPDDFVGFYVRLRVRGEEYTSISLYYAGDEGFEPIISAKDTEQMKARNRYLRRDLSFINYFNYNLKQSFYR